jgi:hypothetical protein
MSWLSRGQERYYIDLVADQHNGIASKLDLVHYSVLIHIFYRGKVNT